MSKAKIENENGNIKIKMLKLEKENQTKARGVTTMNFFKGNKDNAKNLLYDRLKLLVEANPWLAGNLKSSGNDLILEYSKHLDQNRFDQLFNPKKRLGKEIDMPKISSKTEQHDLCVKIGDTPAEMPLGSDSIDNEEPLVALSVLPDELDSDKFIVIFSVSHVIADGYTQQKLLSMLSSDGEIVPLEVKRKYQINEITDNAIGVEEAQLMSSGGIVFNFVSKLLFGSKAEIKSFVVDEERVKEMKKIKDNDLDYISTNDILVSTFGKISESRIMYLPFNTRNKFSDIVDIDAGNYEGALLLTDADIETPSMIRKTLQSGPPTFKRQSGSPLPQCCESLSCKMAMVTNWTFSFYSELKVDGCEFLVHLPQGNVNLVPFDIAVVFKPRAGQLAVTQFVRNISDGALVKDMPISSKSVSNADEFQSMRNSVN